MVYPIVRLRSVVAFLERVAAAIVETCAALGAPGAAWRRDPAGVWLDGKKLAACGIHVARGVSVHGFALDVDTPPSRVARDPTVRPRCAADLAGPRARRADQRRGGRRDCSAPGWRELCKMATPPCRSRCASPCCTTPTTTPMACATDVISVEASARAVAGGADRGRVRGRADRPVRPRGPRRDRPDPRGRARTWCSTCASRWPAIRATSRPSSGCSTCSASRTPARICSRLASCLHKRRTKDILIARGIPTPPYRFLADARGARRSGARRARLPVVRQARARGRLGRASPRPTWCATPAALRKRAARADGRVRPAGARRALRRRPRDQRHADRQRATTSRCCRSTRSTSRRCPPTGRGSSATPRSGTRATSTTPAPSRCRCATRARR